MFCGRCFSAKMFRAFCGRYPCLFCWCSSCSDRRQSRAETTGFRRQRGYGRMPYPPNLCASVPICGRYFSARRFCVFSGFCGRCFSARRFRVFCAFCGRYPCLFCWCSSCSGSRQRRAETTGFRRQRGYGRMPYPPNLCASVPICGRYFSARRFCVFCAFCGNIVSHGFHRSTQMVGCVNSPTEFTEFTEVLRGCWQRGYGRMPYPPNLCASVPICGRYFSARRFCAFRASVGTFTQPVSSVGDYSFSMRKRLTMPKTRA